MSRVLKGALVLALIACTAPITRAADPPTVQPASKLWLTGSSTMHAFTSTASKLDAVVRFDATRWNETLPKAEAIETLIREHGVTGLDVTVPVTSMKSHKDGLDKNMYKALQADRHPQIRYVLSSYDVSEGKPGAMAIDARGKVTVAGVEQDVRINAIATRDGDAVRLKADVPLLMTQFGIKPPTMMMGTLRTADQIVVHFDLIVGVGQASVASTGQGAGR